MTAEADYMLHDENIIAQMDQITKDIACKSPLVSEPEPVENLKPEYVQNEGFLAKIEYLSKSYTNIRRVRGDGNCFYRAYTYTLFDSCQKDPALKEKVYKKLDTTLAWLVKLGMPSFTTEDFHDTFVETLKNHCDSGTYESLMETFNNEGMSNYLVVYVRLLTSGQLQQDSDEYLPFVEGLYKDMKEFCDKEVMPVDREADHLQIKALTDCLSFPLKLVYVDRSEGSPSELIIPDGSNPTVFLLYRPGHYDILYG
ncbi:ubiquitin thioesterase OTUB1-like isoform X2 [Bolinopsis microptera]|uniref:ubiquitin thioesterase OTUB1-like isoform X1 n=1 Tax=Bolinopsis microptera TaxID=2820187 RepID=UPI0030794481